MLVLLSPFGMSFTLPLGILALSRCAWRGKDVSSTYALTSCHQHLELGV